MTPSLTPYRALWGVLGLVLTTGCGPKRDLEREVVSLAAQVDEARAIQGAVCAPIDFATAETQLAFAKVEMAAADPARAAEHVDVAKRAVEVALTASVGCGDADRDEDGIPDAIDACPDDPEDTDGDADDDGCPDLDPAGDVDGDGIPNGEDLCVTQAEDVDRHEDDDGCPEDSPDRDGDGLPDAVDACPDEPGDLNVSGEEDGCPDPDDDDDGVPDDVDACPSTPEDLDQWEDGDGCPEDDNDGDGIHDREDACPTLAGPIRLRGCPADDADRDGVRDADDLCPDEKENRNGVADDDGCADSVATAAVREGDRVVLDGPLPFQGDDLAPAASKGIAAIAALLQSEPGRLRIRSHVDATRDAGSDQLRSELRGTAVRFALTEAGVPGARLVVEAVGGAEPIDTNRTSTGRDRNRRIELVFE